MESVGVDEEKFIENHARQVQGKGQKDVFFIWMLIIFISVIAAHFVLNLTGGSPTGFVTAEQSTESNLFILFGALLVAFVAVLIAGLIYTGITKKDY